MPRVQSGPSEEIQVLHYAVVFLVLALLAAVLGFGGIAAGAAGMAKWLFFLFAFLAGGTFVAGLLARKSQAPADQQQRTSP